MPEVTERNRNRRWDHWPTFSAGPDMWEKRIVTDEAGHSRQVHWDATYAAKAPGDLSWFQRRPDVSLWLIDQALAERPSASLVDVGGGASTLVDHLSDRGFADLTVLDVSPTALVTAQARLGQRARRVAWVAEDVLNWRPDRQFDCWHDRAVFHFLVEAGDRQAYVDSAVACVGEGGAIVLGAFGLEGPTQCSGLPTARYDSDGLAAVFADSFVLERAESEVHITPWGTEQQFTWVVLRRRDRALP